MIMSVLWLTILCPSSPTDVEKRNKPIHEYDMTQMIMNAERRLLGG